MPPAPTAAACAAHRKDGARFYNAFVVVSALYDQTGAVRSSRCQRLGVAVGFSIAATYACGRPQSGDVARTPESSNAALPAVAPSALRPLAAFEVFPAGPERSAALFAEVSRVLLHPRCVNCHVDGDSPAQGEAFALHEPPVVRGVADRGVVGMECGGCHQDQNLQLSRVPGAPDWRLPPQVMAWVGRTPRALCEQLSDKERNGHRTLDEVVDHVGHDAFVSWGWAPGAGRPSAPGTQQEFAALVRAWVDSGATCPAESESL